MELLKMIEIVVLSCKLSIQAPIDYSNVLYKKEKKCVREAIRCVKSHKDHTIMKHRALEDCLTKEK